MQNTQFKYEQGKAICILVDKNKQEYIGEATCHPDDMDMASEKTGCEIAFRRAKIKLYKAYKKELKMKLKVIHDLYYSLNQSKHFNEKSYESKMIRRQLHLIQFDLNTTNEILAMEERNLKDFIEIKDKFYKKVRTYRNNKGISE